MASLYHVKYHAIAYTRVINSLATSGIIVIFLSLLFRGRGGFFLYDHTLKREARRGRGARYHIRSDVIGREGRHLDANLKSQ